MTTDFTVLSFIASADVAAATLVDIAAKGLLVLLAAAIVVVLLRRRSAAERHALWTGAMALLLLLPIFSALAPGRLLRVLPGETDLRSETDSLANAVALVPERTAAGSDAIERTSQSPTQSGAADEKSQNAPQSAGTAANLDEGRIPSDAQSNAKLAGPPHVIPPESPHVPDGAAPHIFTLRLPALMLIIWAAGFVGCLLLLIVDLIALRWIAARAAQITRGPWMEAFDQARAALDPPPVMLLERPGSGMPLVYGLIAPTLVLPADADKWPPLRRRIVVAHELAHVNRRDCATQFLARIACAVHWFNPLAWWALRQMRIERERACDDRVIDVQHGAAAPAAEYASHLLEIARSMRAGRPGAWAAVAMARPSQLEGRLLAILDDHRDRRTVGRAFIAAGCAGALMTLGALAAFQLAPRAVAQQRTTQIAQASPASAAQRADAPGSTASTNPPPATQPAPARKIFAVGKQVEVKWGGQWRRAVVVNHRGDWILIDYDGNKFFREWVEPWRVRDIGSSEDIGGNAPINPYVRHNEGPPRDQPGPAPAAAAPMRNRGAADNPRENQTASDVPITPVVRDNVKSVALDGLPPLTSLAPDAAAPVQWVTAPIALSGSNGQFFDHLEALLLSPASGIAAVFHFFAPPGGVAPQYRIERVDMKAGKSLNVSTLPLELHMLDLSSDGRLLLARTGPFGPGRSARLDVWQIDGQNAAHVVTFMPFTPRTGGEQIVWAHFAGPDHVLVRSFDGELSCFEFRKAIQIWSAKAGLSNTNALSATGKYLAASTGHSIAIVEPLSGRALGAIDIGDQPAQSLAFAPDGKQLAAAGQDEVSVWDLSHGASVSDIWSVGAPGQAVEFGASGYLLLDHTHLVSLSKQVIAWTYRGVAPAMHGQLAQVWNGRMYYTADAASPGQPHRPVIASVALPDESVAGVLASAGDPKLALHPGMNVSLDVNVDGSIRQQVTDALTASLKTNGISLAANQPIKLLAKDEPGQTREVEYRRIGFGARGQMDKISVQETKRLLQIAGADGKPLWQRGGTLMPPPLLSLKAGQSAQAAVAEAMKPSAKFYESQRLPRYIPKLLDGFGATQLSASGPQTPQRAAP